MSCLYHLCEENAQVFLEDNLGRKLTPIEIYRIKYAFIENQTVACAVMDMMYHAGKDAIDNSNGQWDQIDADFKKGINVFDDLNCKAK